MIKHSLSISIKNVMALAALTCLLQSNNSNAKTIQEICNAAITAINDNKKPLLATAVVVTAIHHTVTKEAVENPASIIQTCKNARTTDVRTTLSNLCGQSARRENDKTFPASGVVGYPLTLAIILSSPLGALGTVIGSVQTIYKNSNNALNFVGSLFF